MFFKLPKQRSIVLGLGCLLFVVGCLFGWSVFRVIVSFGVRPWFVVVLLLLFPTLSIPWTWVLSAHMQLMLGGRGQRINPGDY